MKVTNTESSKKISSLSFASIMSVFMVAGSLSITTPALKVIGNYFPDISATTIRLCSTLPGLLLVPTTLLSGWLVATRCRYKPIILFGAAAYIITGILPYFMNNFYAILIDRAMFGLALGILYPLGSALVLRLYRGAECERNIGRGTAVMSLALVLMQLGAGIVAAYSWRNVFLIHLIGAITFILILVACPEPEKIVRASKAEKARIPKDQREKFPARIVLIYLAFWLGNVMMSTVMINASYIVSGKGLGDSAVAGLLNSLVTFSGIFVGVLFGHIRKFTGNYTIGVGLIIGSLGMAIIFLAQNVFMLAAGALILGVGFILPQPALTYEIGLLIPQSAVSTATGVQWAMKELGFFLSGFFITLIDVIVGNPADATSPIIAAAVIQLVIGIVFCVVRRFRPLPVLKEDAG